jgi:hypothetical protein
LRDTELVGRKKPVAYAVSRKAEPVFDGLPCAATTVANKIRYILDDEVPWLMRAQNTYNIVDQVTPLGAFETVLVASFRERLARKACAENVVRGKRRDIETSNVAVGSESEVFLVEASEV